MGGKFLTIMKSLILWGHILMGIDFENESVRLGFVSSRSVCNNLLKGDITNVFK